MRKDIEQQFPTELEVREAIVELSRALLDTDKGVERISRMVNRHAMELTRSVHGYVGTIDPETGHLVTHTLTDMGGDSCRIPNPGAVFPKGGDGHYASLWGHVLNERTGMFFNAPAEHPSSSGVPDGHVPLARYMAAPAIYGEELVGQVAVANAPHDYDEQDLALLQRLADLLAISVNRDRVKRRLEETTEELEQKNRQLADLNERLESRVLERTQALAHQVEEHERTEAELRKITLAVDQTSDIVAVLDSDGRLEYANQAFHAIVGHPSGGLFGRTATELGLGEDFPEVHRLLSEAISTGSAGQGMVTKRGSSGEPGHFWFAVSPVRAGGGPIDCFVVTGRDLTGQRSLEAQLFRLANYDAVTGVLNRTQFLARLDEHLRETLTRGGTTTLAKIAIDRFETIMDGVGLRHADAVLKEAASRLADELPAGTLLGRVGNARFAFLVPGCSSAVEAAGVAERVRSQLSRPVVVGDHEIPVAFSVAVTVAPDDGSSGDELMPKLSAALREAQSAGGRRIQFHAPVLDAAVRDELRLEREMLQAIRNDEFVVYYQPQVRLSDRRAVGLEALLKWQSPRQGLVDPAVFLPLLERTGLIVEVGELMLAKVCSQVSAWLTEHPGVPTVWVNLSPAQVTQPDLPASVSRVVQSAGIDAGLIGFELAEAATSADREHSMRVLARLSAMGHPLALDQFGAHPTSIAFLRKLSMDRLKIAGSLIRGIDNDPDTATLVDTLINLGRGLRMTVVAGGVETEAQLEVLYLLGCELAQGYFCLGPVLPEELIRCVSVGDREWLCEPDARAPSPRSGSGR